MHVIHLAQYPSLAVVLRGSTRSGSEGAASLVPPMLSPTNSTTWLTPHRTSGGWARSIDAKYRGYRDSRDISRHAVGDGVEGGRWVAPPAAGCAARVLLHRPVVGACALGRSLAFTSRSIDGGIGRIFAESAIHRRHPCVRTLQVRGRRGASAMKASKHSPFRCKNGEWSGLAIRVPGSGAKSRLCPATAILPAAPLRDAAG